MPFKSETQRRFLWAKHPTVARKWAKEEKSMNPGEYARQKGLALYTKSRGRRRRGVDMGPSGGSDSYTRASANTTEEKSMTYKRPKKRKRGEARHIGSLPKNNEVKRGRALGFGRSGGTPIGTARTRPGDGGGTKKKGSPGAFGQRFGDPKYPDGKINYELDKRAKGRRRRYVA